MKNRQLEHHQHSLPSQNFPFSLLAHNLDRTGNVGSLFRIADALGVETLYLSGSTPKPPNAKIRKSSRSTEKYVNHHYEKDPVALVTRLKSEGVLIAALELTSLSQDICKVNLEKGQKICLILGSETYGVPDVLLDICDITLHIPMRGVNSSMNVADACAIAVYTLIQRLYIEPDNS